MVEPSCPDRLADGDLGTHLGDECHRVHHPHQHADGAHCRYRAAAQPPYPEDIDQVVGHLDKADGHQRQRQLKQLPEDATPRQITNVGGVYW